MVRVIVCVLLLAACGTSTTGMSGPTISGRIGDRSEEAPAIQSNDILQRDRVATRVVVQHVLIGWRDLADNYGFPMDTRARARSRTDADDLAVATLARVRVGEDMAEIMREISEDTGSAATGKPYDVTPEAGLVFEFKRLSLRLAPGEAGLVKTIYGWHVIKRIE
jgi:hypothetical protein